MSIDQTELCRLIYELNQARSALRSQDHQTRTDEVLVDVIDALTEFLRAHQQ